MKRLFTRKSKQSQTLKKTLRFNPIIALAIVVAVGGIGAWTIKNSSAAIDNTISILSVQTGSGARVYDVTFQIYSTNGGYCSTPTTFSPTGSGYAYNSCSSTNSAGQGAWYCITPSRIGNDYTYHGYGEVVRTNSTVPYPFQTTTHNGNICVYVLAGQGVNIPFYFNAKSTTSLAGNSEFGSVSVTKGKAVALFWSSTNARTCGFTGGEFDTRNETSGNVSFIPEGNITLTVACQGHGTGTDSSSTLKVTVTNPSAPPPTNSPNPSTSKPPSSTPQAKKQNTKTQKAAPIAVKATVVATSGDTSPPSKPADFSGTKNEDGNIELKWAAASDNVGIKSYVVERSVDTIDWKVLGQDITETSYTDNDLSDDATYYYYRLRAQDEVGNQSEAAFIDMEYTSGSSTSYTDEDLETAAPQESKKKGMSGAMVGLSIVGGLLLIGLIVAALIVYRRRKANDYDYNQYQTPSQPVQTYAPPAQPNNTVMPGQQQNAPHTSRSLKDMVLEDYDPNRHDGPPSPPPQPGQQ